MIAKITLPADRTPHYFGPKDDCQTELKASLPFFKGRQGAWIHRVRSGKIYWRQGEYSHTCIKFWCNGTGFVGSKGELLADPDGNAVFCRVCEDALLKKGLPETGVLLGRVVTFSPLPVSKYLALKK
jgi:hypothetical protein